MEKAKKMLVPIVTPFNDDETVNYEMLAKLTRKMLDDGADGIYAGGSSAECFLLTQEEREKCLETVIKAADGAYIVAHVGDIGTKKTIALAKHAEKAGADVVASVPPFYFGYGFAGIKSYYQDLSSSVKIPTLVYNIPVATGKGITSRELEELMMIPGVDYLKFTDSDYYMMERVHTRTGKFVYSGKDECFLSAIAAGADGGIGTTFNFMIDKYTRIWDAYHAGKVDEALKIQKSANAITEAVVTAGTIPATKYLLSLQGYDAGMGRRPFVPLKEESKAILEKVYEENIHI